ncbi:defect in organelle trafficking protein DotA (plasmid) [Legionella adelaidensis]|uniref:Defect in organelle trafficking protein DotA n=1 Tax=Legionella adelaidensis TaxID=45056 RepID=A0A0W0R0A3_9GAMM|nr:type IVB secretion system protein DotA [Legionella adelaidensis]KTC64511.1 defect in organelle trafficking protein DotA [Legionella adelaidensis]VEH85879.1 defect in organelle trafficking protein DotA [Legionella adelaidensis]
MKNKFSLGFILSLFPILAFAEQSSMSFAPPPGDYSVIFLSNIFGVVDGVLHGTGSQIMGAIFSVFNSAVLALGGIIIMYTLLVSTLNTAHEGQMLGQKWSSLWIPIRSTVGLALLIPKASGYCLMQVFVMWIVVQGVGAADKVWDAALGYLNRGGVIVQPQMGSSPSFGAGSATQTSTTYQPVTTATIFGPITELNAITTITHTPGVAMGAQAILAGQVCMIGLQTALENQRSSYISQKNQQKGSGPCVSPSDNMKILCENQVPDFLSTVNAVSVQNNRPTATSWTVSMPQFDTSSPYESLNGICGTITWNSLASQLASANVKSQSQAARTGGANIQLNDGDFQTAEMSRAIALQQMYMDLSQIAQVMVNNNPALNPSMKATNPTSMVANQQFGIPIDLNGTICTDANDPHCYGWSGENGGSALFNGTEFRGAISDYNGIMMPTLNLMKEANNATLAQNTRAFINQASSSGWMMAGSYFFNLVSLNQQGLGNSNLTDTNTGIEGSTYKGQQLVSCSGNYSIVCDWFQNDLFQLQSITTLVNGNTPPPSWVGTPPPSSPVPSNIPTPSLKPGNPPPAPPVYSGANASTVYGFTSNSNALKLPDQPGQKPLQFANLVNISPDTTTYQLPEVPFECGYVKTFMFSFCMGQIIGDILYNDILRPLYNFFLSLFGSFIQSVINAFLMVPIQGMAFIFQTGLAIVSNPQVNPIVALAQMGTYYINFAANMWLMLIEMSIVSVLIPLFGIFIFALIALAMPVILAWMGVMVAIGFSTAYYVPVFPYIIFTFGAIAWIMAVIEAMVAAPIVALGVTHPEGHDAFGKGEQAIMILMNVFLRPAMMIIGYIAAIALSYVGVWILNAGFDNAIGFVQGDSQYGTLGPSSASDAETGSIGSQGTTSAPSNTNLPTVDIPQVGQVQGGYTGWAGVFAFFFSILIYTSLYLTIVQKAFTLIVILPDRILRWIGGAPESVGQEVERWAGETGGKVEQGAKATQEGQAAMDKQMAGYIGKAKKALSDSSSQGGKISAEGE